MGDVLKVDTAALREAGTSLRTVAAEFDRANAHSDDVASHVGHAGLSDAIKHFAHGWDDRRAKMVDSIAGLADACTGIGDGFEDLDREFAKALRGES
ncbi:hypothetical protein [Cellulomonas sp.]|uniref:hypothetical protein n=1 Tax=Cellulomonas sp. TaxID=40001 RepID=UPI001B1E33E0|nr:hypothetical protein [Cellulomonas sp.]MBO9556330.1 hypothetical protein [Cellulomonas sp.]